MRPPGSPERLEERRRKAIGLLRSGETYQKVAWAVKASVSSVVRWNQAYQQNGKTGLRTKPIPGRPPRLTPVQTATLTHLLVAGAQQAGYATDLWTLRRVADLIEKRFGVHYGLTGVSTPVSLGPTFARLELTHPLANYLREGLGLKLGSPFSFGLGSRATEPGNMPAWRFSLMR
jgi:transposase